MIGNQVWYLYNVIKELRMQTTPSYEERMASIYMKPGEKIIGCLSFGFPLTSKMEDYLPKPPMVSDWLMQEMTQPRRGKLQPQTGGFSVEGPLNVHIRQQ